MRRALLAAVATLVVLAAPVQASSDSASHPKAPVVDASAWYLVGEDGAVLAARRAREQRAIASITKLMTAVVALEHAQPSDVVVVPGEAVGIGGSTGNLRAGETLSVVDLVRAALIPSGNDAAQALALYVGRGSTSSFVRLMNRKARELGMSDTTFRNAHGLDAAGHVSSARDTTTLVRYALGIPVVRDTLGRSTYSLGPGRELETTSDLNGTWAPFLGGKTGHTDDAGWSEAAAARGGGVTVYGTVLGSDSRSERNDALRSLLRFGLRSYVRVAVVDRTRTYATAETGYGAPELGLVAPRTLVRTVERGTPLVERVVAPEAVGLPVRKGAKLGRVEVYAGDRLLASSNLVAAEDVSEAGFLDKTWWYVKTTASNFVELFS
jgi:D-alanyl-D-alanine carboxypeptidase (penicillin-binding protein 5/6)